MGELIKAKNDVSMIDYSPEQVELIKRTVCTNSTNDELQLFMYVAKKSGLDPFAKQIHAVKRWTKNGEVMSIQVGIDGYRLIAHRTGKCAGITDAEFVQKDDSKFPESAKVTVRKIVEGHLCEFTATAYWEEYYNEKQGYMWRQRPKGQLGKCAEALALRKAFPNELSGLYTPEEMERAETLDAIDEEIATKPVIDYAKQGEQISEVGSILGDLTTALSIKEKGEYMVKNVGIANFNDLKKKTNAELDNLIIKLKAIKK